MAAIKHITMACNLAYTYPSKEDKAPITNKCMFM